MSNIKYPKTLPGGIKFTQKLKYKRKTNFLEYLKEYQKLLLKKKC
jgi:hypothetical protein